MLSEDEVAGYEERLAIYRRALAHYLKQQAQLGEAYAPPSVFEGIRETREHIRQIKNLLRAAGLPCDNFSDDEPLTTPPGAARTEPVDRPIFFIPNNLPASYVERVGALEALRAALLRAEPTVGVVAEAALHGMGGLGKTVLARAICDDQVVRAAFPDGILWATLGQDAETARHQREWIRALGGDVTASSSLESGAAELRRLLEPRAMLLVLDDMWQAADAQPLRMGGPRCATLITTRDAGQISGSALVSLELMQPKRAARCCGRPHAGGCPAR